MEEQKIEQKSKINKPLLIGLIILIFSLLMLVAYWLLPKEDSFKKLSVSLLDEKQEENKSFDWKTFESTDGHFRIDYPKNWQISVEEDVFFAATMDGNQASPKAKIEIKKIEATNKIELQEALDNEHKICIEENKECLPAINIDELTRFKISGETARIDTDNKYLSGTTIYIYVQNYYLAIHLEYDDEYSPIFKNIVDSISINVEQKLKHYYCNREPNKISYHNKLSAYCHTVESGDTLWNIAERYYGDPYLWKQLKLLDGEGWGYAQLNPEDPNILTPGTQLVVWPSFAFVNDDRIAAGTSDGWGIDTDTGDLFSTADGKIYINNEIYDQGFAMVYNFLVDERTNNKIYIVSPKREEGEIRKKAIFQFVFNRQRNQFVGPGANFELIAFNHNEDKYALRTNVRQDVPNPGFIVLSNIGNGPEYDYLDSIIWYDNDILIYRAQTNDEWRLVVNHEDYKIYDYIENLRVEDNIIKFDARNKSDEWSKEEISLDKNQYNTELVSIPDEPPVGEDFFTYLKNTRGDLSEADIFRIEKNYHYKKGTLVDEFGNLIEDPVTIYLDPLPDVGMSEDINRLTFTVNNGTFELFVYEIGPYNLSLEDGWLAEGIEEINPIDFRYAEKQTNSSYANKEYKITVHNEDYDKKAKAKYTYKANSDDTLMSMSTKYYGQKYYWPLIANNNDLDYLGGMPQIREGDELYMPPLIYFSNIEELDGLRKKFHAENDEPLITLKNTEYSYSIDYPECWQLGSVYNKPYNENDPYYDSYIHKQWIMGPEYPNLPGKGRKPFIFINVYDNKSGLDVEEFIIAKKIVDKYNLDNKNYSFETLENGGILVLGSSGDVRHTLFFIEDMVYDVAREDQYSIDETSKQEALDMVKSFKILKD